MVAQNRLRMYKGERVIKNQIRHCFRRKQIKLKKLNFRLHVHNELWATMYYKYHEY